MCGHAYIESHRYATHNLAANGRKAVGMDYQRTIKAGMFVAAACVLASCSGCAGGGDVLHLRRHAYPDFVVGSVRIEDGVLRGGLMDIPAEGLTLDEAVSRSLRAGAKLASSQYGGDIPPVTTSKSMPSAGAYQEDTSVYREKWFVVIAREGTSHFIPVSFVQYTPFGSLELRDGDVLAVVPAEPFYDSEDTDSRPTVRVASATVDASGMVGPAILSEWKAQHVSEVFEAGRGGYVAVRREVGGVRGTFVVPDVDQTLRLVDNDVVHWIEPAVIHRLLSKPRFRGSESDGGACLDVARRRSETVKDPVRRALEPLAARLRAAPGSLGMPRLF